MEGLTAWEWYHHGLQIIGPLLFALIIWQGRTALERTRVRYSWGLAMLLYVIADLYEVFAGPRIPPAFLAIRLLCLAVLALTVILAWPRKKT